MLTGACTEAERHSLRHLAALSKTLRFSKSCSALLEAALDICCLLIFGLIYLTLALSLLFVFLFILDCICCRKRLCALFGVGHNSKYLGSAVDTWCHSKSWWTQGSHPRCFYAHPSPRLCEQNIKHFWERAAAFEIVGPIFLHG